MNPSELLRMVDTIHRDKSIDKEVLFQAIEAALISATKKNFFGEDKQIYVHIDRTTGEIEANCNGEPISPDEEILSTQVFESSFSYHCPPRFTC